jgi:hypothetical protein
LNPPRRIGVVLLIGILVPVFAGQAGAPVICNVRLSLFMKILSLFSVPAFIYLGCINAQPETNYIPEYSITDVNEVNVRVTKKPVFGMTVEHFTSYINVNEYTIKINVHKNKNTNILDSTLVLECFFSEK